MPASRSSSVGKGPLDEDSVNEGASSHSSLARWQARQAAAAAAAAAAGDGASTSSPPTTTTTTENVGHVEANRAVSQEPLFDFSNRPSGASPSQPRRAAGPSSRGGELPPQPRPQPPQPQESRRPPVDAEAIGSQWEARYKAEKTPRAATTSPTHTSTSVTTTANPETKTVLQRYAQQQPEASMSDVAADDTTDLLEAFRVKEREALETRRALLEAEAQFKKELETMHKLLANEKSARQKAEQDVEELLAAHMQISPSISPQSTHLAVNPTSAQSLSEEAALSSQNQQQPMHAEGRTTASTDALRLSTVSGINAAAASDTFWQKMKEREERARAKVRKEFIQQSQQKLYAEQDKRAEAEKVAKEAERRMRTAEERAAAQTEAVKECQKTIDTLKGVISEREVKISELETSRDLLQRQLALRDEDRDKEKGQLLRRCADMQELVASREQALEEQRTFTQNLLKELGLKDKDLLDRESMNKGVMREIHNMQNRYKAEQEAFEARYKDRELALKQELEHHVTTINALKAQCEDYKSHNALAEGELAKLRGQLTLNARDVEAERDRLQGQLIELGVEKRSLELQLERVSEAAGRYAKDYSSTKENERTNREALIRRYTAEITSLQEELDRVALQRKRDQERSLQEILQMGQELSALKHQNTKYEHALNVLEHDRTQATRLLSQVREDNQLLLEDKRRESMSNANASGSLSRNAGGRLSIVQDQVSMDAKDRRIAELEAVRGDLKEKLTAAQVRVRLLEEQLAQLLPPSPQHSAGPLAVVSRTNHEAAGGSPTHARTDELRRRQQELEAEVRRLQLERDALETAVARARAAAAAAPPRALPPPPTAIVPRSAGPVAEAGGAPAANAAAIYAALVNMVRMLEENTALNKQHGKQRSHSDTGGANRLNSILDEKDYYFRHLERDALDQVLSSCLAALDCLQGNRSGSPYFSEGESSFSRSGKAAGDKPKHGNPHRIHHRPHAEEEIPRRLQLLEESEARLIGGSSRQPSGPPPLPRPNVVSSQRDAAGAERTELEAEPCWEDDRDGLRPKPNAAGSHSDDDDDEVFVPHRGDGILRFSPIPASLPQSSMPSPTPIHQLQAQGPNGSSMGRASLDPLFHNISIRGLVSSSSNTPVPDDISHPRRSSPPPPQYLRKRQSI